MDYPLEPRCVDILKMMIQLEGPVRISALTEQLDISRRSAYYDLDKIDAWLTGHHLSPLVRDRARGISVQPEQSRQIQQLLFQPQSGALPVFSPVERERLIFCMVLLSADPVYMDDFMDWCMVSRNTIVSDLKNLTRVLRRSKLKLYYQVKKGYRIQGSPVHIRALFCLHFPHFLPYIRDNLLSEEHRERLSDYHLRYKAIEQALGKEYVTGILPALTALTDCIVTKPCAPDFLRLSDADRKRITRTEEHRQICAHFPELPEEEQLYLALHLLGSSLQVNSLALEEGIQQAEELARRLTDSFEEITGIPCSDQKELIAALTAHLRTSMYRYKYGIQMGNPMLEDIRSQYRELFELTKAAFLRISDEMSLHISDSEIAYLALHFGSCLGTESVGPAPLRIVIFCPNGVGAGRMIQREVRKLVPQATEVINLPLSRYSGDLDYDLVLSTVPIVGEQRLIQVSPILTDVDKISILRRSMRFNPAERASLEEILEIGRRYVPTEVFPSFAQELEHYFSALSGIPVPTEDYGYGLCHFLTPTHIQFLSDSGDWETALRFACQPLLLDDSITQNYVETIVTAHREKGQYMLLTPGLVLAHAKAEEGSKRVDAAMTICARPVLLGNGKEARIIVALSVVDQTQHIQILNDILAVFSDKKSIPALTALHTQEEVLKYLQKKLATQQ